MGQEFIIKSQALEDKVNQLLPSQGGFQAGVDLSASTTIIPIIDLTESAEGSEVRPDLQTALSFSSVSTFAVSNTTTTIVNTTGYFRVFGTATATFFGNRISFNLNDGATVKRIIDFSTGTAGGSAPGNVIMYDFIVFLKAGDSLEAQSSGANFALIGCTRQVADINGNLIDP